MELTQRLECTQELFSNQSERLCPEQIGFIGICGTKYPVKKGPNKIGRDPQTCNIVLNLNSISRQHAVLNVLSNNEYMLMDLDSANKTKLQDKTLKPYIPHPLKNGDTIQFGQVFGIFRLLEEETDLPMTQALDIPDTPVANRFVSRIHQVTTVPESPDASDKDDSFIAPSQPKQKNAFKSPNTNYIKTSGKTISIQPVGQKKIDNAYCNSSKKSDSFNLHNNSSSINESWISVKSSDTSDLNNIHEQDTQIPNQLCNISNNESLFDAATQIPDVEAEKPSSPNIYSMETQVPVKDCEDKNNENHIESVINDKENDVSIFNAETQQLEFKTPTTIQVINKVDVKDKSHSSDDIILFDEIDSQTLDDNFESQAILPPSPIFNKSNNSSSSRNTSLLACVSERQKVENKIEAKILKIKSPLPDSTKIDDFDFLPTQIIPKKCIENPMENDDIDILPTQKILAKENDDDVTDCEDEIEVPKERSKPAEDEDLTDFEDNLDDEKIAPNKELNFEELATQVIEEDVPKNTENKGNSTNCNFEDMLTQIIPEENGCDKSNEIINLEDMPTQVIPAELPKAENKILKQISVRDFTNFKVPVMSPKAQKKKGISKVQSPIKVTPKSDIKLTSSSSTVDDDDSNYYAATQELFDDLCTQKETEISEHETERQLTKDNVQNISLDSSEGEDKIEQFVSSLSRQQIREVVGVSIPLLKRMPSDSSDMEVTPRKITPLQFMEIDLPNSQEIKTSVTLQSKATVTDSSSDSDTDKDTKPNTPLVFKSKKRISKEAKIDLTKKFDTSHLPSRIITRVRKPTEKVLNGNQSNISKSILKSKIIMDQEDGINTDIINENLARLKSEKSKNIDSETSKTSKEAKSGNKTEPQKIQIKETPALTSKEASNDIKIDNNKKQENIDANIIKDDKGSRKTRSSNKNLSNTQINESSVNKSNSDSITEDSRETRSRRKANTTVSKRSTAIEIEPLPAKRTRNKRVVEIIDSSPETEVRRSRRTKSNKEENDKSKNTSSSNQHEESTVYSISSGSDVASPRLKRSASKDFLFPPRKRGRPPRPATALGIGLRATPARKLKTQHVLLTAFPNEEVKTKLEELGAVIVTDVKKCTVVLMLKIKRTFKFLCAVGLGKPIVGQQWVQACVDNKVIVDPWLYLLHDEEMEERFHFSLQRTLVSKRNFLKGYNITSTPSAQPPEAEMKLIVQCSGGQWKKGGTNWVVVSSRNDKHLWPDLLEMGAIIVSTEFILGGVMLQKLEVDRYRLA
ncbi:uncharacterized protein LOC123697502 [Colias croceus]|uniref:uncharacterized protein LOC123697502 n=1 Tax=Colias crocea TaxID=72248 RepID=UPI001E27A9B3|nr:uncharacterized protein LOC123697502 [Colias croceus]